MKKLVFSVAMIATCATISAQVLQSENFDSYTVGNIGGNTTGSAAGQGGIFTYNGTAADYQIVNVDAAHGKSYQIIGGATAQSASNRFSWQNGLDDAWADRTDGNDVFVCNFEIYTGDAAGNHRIGAAIYDGEGAGIAGITYNTQTKTINGLARLVNDSDSSTGFYPITGLTSATFPANTWIKVGYSYNYGTGEITYTINGATGSLKIKGYSTPAEIDPSEMDYLSFYSASNTVKSTNAMDNMTIVAQHNSVLSTTNIGNLDSSVQVKIYPNPATDYLTIDTKSKVLSAKVVDMAGRVVAAQSSDKTVNVANLSKGNYILVVETSEGKSTHKFIKK